jgi:hypothetical protein
MWRLTTVLIILILNLAYVGSKIVDDARAHRWTMLLLGIACTIGIYGIIVGDIYLSVESSTDL